MLLTDLNCSPPARPGLTRTTNRRPAAGHQRRPQKWNSYKVDTAKSFSPLQNLPSPSVTWVWFLALLLLLFDLGRRVRLCTVAPVSITSLPRHLGELQLATAPPPPPPKKCRVTLVRQWDSDGEDQSSVQGIGWKWEKKNREVIEKFPQDVV